MRKIWIAVLLLVFLVPVVTISAVNAASNHDNDDHDNLGKGTLSFSQGATISGPTTRGENTISTVHETLTFTGNLTGTAKTIQRNVQHTDTDDGHTFTFTTFHGQGNFTGTLNSVKVTLHIRYEGFMNSTFARGDFVVHGDTDSNHGVQGEGHFRGSPTGEGQSAINYTMHSHVSSHAEHPETDDEKEDD